eukprot:scaffold378_cov270-Chaetoceros_neogracile.AAC.26
MDRMKTKVDGLNNFDASAASISSEASDSTRDTPRQFGTQLHAPLGNWPSLQSSAETAYVSSRFTSATNGNEMNAIASNDATCRIIHNSNSKIQVNGNSTGHPSSNNNNLNSTSAHLSNLHRMLAKIAVNGALSLPGS